jgi:hypothetical protein
MKTDLYTKTILTLIALCLVWMCLNGVTPSVRAQGTPPPPTPVVLVDSRGVPLITTEGLRVNLGGLTTPVPMVLTAIERHGVWQPIQVDVLRPPPTLMPTP